MSGEFLDARDLPTRLRLQAGQCRRLGSPLYAELLRRAADDVAAGGPLAVLLRGREDEAEVRLTLWPDGEDRLIGHATYHGDLVDLRRAM